MSHSADVFRELKADFERHGRSLRNPAIWVLGTYRFGRWVQGWPRSARALGSATYGAMLTGIEFLFGSAVYCEATIGSGIHLIHGDGIRIANAAVIGERVGIMNGVVIGTTPDRQGVPVIGNDVFIGAGAKILGPVHIGDRARIAANSLVISDVPPDTTAIGVPARIMRYTGRAVPSQETPGGEKDPREGSRNELGREQL